MKILYIATNFTAITHTFITREIGQLQKKGHTVGLLSVRTHTEQKGALNPECDLSDTITIYPISLFQIIKGLINSLIKQPANVFKAARIALCSRDDTITVRLKLIYQLAIALSYSTCISSEKYTHIHSHFASSPTSFALFLHLLTEIPFSFTGHAADIFREQSALKAKLLNASGVVAISKYNHDYYNTLVPNLDTIRIHCGLDLNKHEFKHRQKPNTPIRILSVGRSVPKKGFEYLIDALKIISEAGIEWSCDIAGGGPLEQSLKHKAEQNNLKNLVLHGPLQQIQIRKLLEQSDLFVLPCIVADDGDRDNIPVSLMEAMAEGCPVVSTDVAGIPELIGQSGEYGIMTKQRNAQSIADAIISLVNNHNVYSSFSLKGRERIENEFNVVKSADQLLELYSHPSKDKP